MSEARPEWFLAAEKDLRDSFFKIIFFAVLGKIEWLETGKMAGPGALRELDSNSWWPWPGCGLKAQYLQCHSQHSVNCLYINAIFKVWFKRLLRVKPALCCSADKASFEFSLAMCQRKKVISERGYCRCLGPWSECEVERPGQHLQLSLHFSPDALTNRAVREVTPKGTSAKQRGSLRCGYHFFWWSHRGAKGPVVE